jgi:dephospho-CoA kinase
VKGNKKIVLGITGGIGAGKSTVARFFKYLGADLIDADKIAHKIIREDSVKKKLVKLWGEKILTKRRMIDRKKLACMAFEGKNSIKLLNSVLHPMILKKMKKMIKDSKRRIVVLDAPLLFEAKSQDLCDVFVFVDAPLKERIKRLKKIKRWDKKELLRRERFQIDINQKKKRADYIINNTSSTSSTFARVRRIYFQLNKNG